MNPQTCRIALFGGSFDPVHCGHLEMAARAVEEARLDELRFLPARVSPFKTGGPPPASAEERMEMLRLATAALPWAVVDDRELRREPPSYSYLTAMEMAAKYPQARLFWLLGRDQWEALPMWKRPDVLAELLEFLVFSRDGDPRPRQGWKMRHLPGAWPASSTAIRRQLREAAETPWLPDVVRKYIDQHQLYR